MTVPRKTTQFRQALSEANSAASESLLEFVYDELRSLAQRHFRRQPGNHTLQPTALVHEAFLKLAGQAPVEWESRAHFLAVAARAMRQILIDHARGKEAVKRGGGVCRVTLDDALTPVGPVDPEMIDLEACLLELAELDARQGRIVELRFFGGMTVEEVAHVLDLSKTTIESEWRMARAWLRSRLASGGTAS